MMATTEIDKVPPTIQSRSQVFELKTIGVKQIADQIRAIAAAEAITIDDAAVMAIARAGDGSMRDAQSAFDQVIAFAGSTITAEDVATVLGLVRRDLLLDMASAVAREDAAAVFQLADRAVESGYELRTVLRELGRLVRDLLVISIDPSRLSDPEIAAEGEQDQLKEVAALFSHEDLMRAFDVLTKGEEEIRSSMQPRFHLEMTLLRWIHLRKLVPLSDLIEGLDRGTPRRLGDRRAPARPPLPRPSRPAACPRAARHPRRARPSPPVGAAREGIGRKAGRDLGRAASRRASPARSLQGRLPRRDQEGEEVLLRHGDRAGAEDPRRRRSRRDHLRPAAPRAQIAARADEAAPRDHCQPAGGKKDDAWCRPKERSLADQPGRAEARASPRRAADGKKAALREQAMADSGVQAMLDVFAAEIKDVEEM